MSDEKNATAVDGVVTNLPAEAVADLQPKVDEQALPEAKPGEGDKPEVKPAGEPKPDEQPDVKAPESGEKPAIQPKARKAGPIADLLAKKHDLETQLEAERASKAELQRTLDGLSKQPDSPAADAKVNALAERYGLEPEVIRDIVGLAREGNGPAEIPKEVTDLIEESRMRKAQEAEEAAFEKRVSSLASAIPNEPIAAHKDRIMQLAYSDGADPNTGERYADMELAEIYFRYVKPEVEPGKPSGEAAATSGSRAGGQVLDFQEVFDRDDPKDVDAMDDKTFAAYSKWLNDKGGNLPLQKARR